MVLLCLCFTCHSDSLARTSSDNCEKEGLGVYADSLHRLILAYQPNQVVQVSDSLLLIYDAVDCSEVVRIKSMRANAYELLYKFETSVEIYNQLVKIVDANKLYNDEVAIRLSLARVYETISRPELCAENLDKAKMLIDKFGFVKQLPRYYVRASSYQRIYKDIELAKVYATKAIELGKEYGNDRSVADGNLVMGIVTNDDFEASVQYAIRSSEQYYALGDIVGSIFQLLNVARKYLGREDYKKVLEIVDTSNEQLEEVKENTKVYYMLKKIISKIKADVFEGTANKDELIKALKDFNEYSNLFGQVVNQEQINGLILENAISEEKEKIEAAKKENRRLFIGLFLLSGVTLLLLRLYFMNNRKKNKIQEQTQTISKQYDELQKLYNYQSTLLSEVHHRIKNNLQLIISLLALQKSRLSDDEYAEILDMPSQRINSIALIHEQLYNSKEFDKIDVRLYCTDLLNNYKLLISKRNIVIDHNIGDISLNLETITPLGLIWSELLSNSVKYNPDAEHLSIYFDLIKSGEMYYMHYHDNGIGYPDGHFSANKVGMGFTIINSLSRQLSGKSNSYNSDGAHFTLAFKEKIISPL